MASSIIHLGITNELIKRHSFRDVDRLKLGVVLPDAVEDSADSHFKIRLADSDRRTYDLNRYRKLFGECMKNDDLYLGYYLHLIQDLKFRHFMYDTYRWNPYVPGNVDRLHRDYALSNFYVIKHYGLKKDLKVPEDIRQEPLYRQVQFQAESQVKEIEESFAPMEEEEPFFFTAAMADEFIDLAVSACLEELEAMEKGQPGTDMYENAWETQKR